MAEKPIIFTNRTNAGIEVTVRQGTDGRDILHTALILLKIVFGDATGMEPVADIDSAFEDVKAIYKAEYVDDLPLIGTAIRERDGHGR